MYVYGPQVVAALLCSAVAQQVPVTSSTTEENEEPPEGYYAFVESPNATPPRVRPPPYRQSNAECTGSSSRPHVSAHNLCGDLNRGLVPRNPLGQLPGGEPYPFELIRNETLRFLSRTLPVLRADDALPRVAHVAAAPQRHQQQQQYHHQHPHYPQPSDLPQLPELAGNRLEDRVRRSAQTEQPRPQQHEAAESARLPAEHRGEQRPREARKFCDGGGV
ncbi:unnamed protein product [Parnassius apollo]|uniref:(apollo) hypothetical protein n=1 Tax=Parnassius apollo TaxID=110799 RepID=A0A8S3X9J4_PARAO|nr:unnamed protein product [Parnassius apollo]